MARIQTILRKIWRLPLDSTENTGIMFTVSRSDGGARDNPPKIKFRHEPRQKPHLVLYRYSHAAAL